VLARGVPYGPGEGVASDLLRPAEIDLLR